MIEKDLKMKTCHLIIDQLLITGNNNNRFVICDVVDGRVITNKASKYEANLTYKEMTAKTLMVNHVNVNNSSLTLSEKKQIKKGIII